MKKIRNIRDLENEQLRLRVKQLELEKQMNQTWKGFKGNLSSIGSNGQKQTTTDAFNIKTGNTLLSGVLNYGAFLLGQRLGNIAGKKVEDGVGQVVGLLAGKINSLFAKRKRFRKSRKNV